MFCETHTPFYLDTPEVSAARTAVYQNEDEAHEAILALARKLERERDIAREALRGLVNMTRNLEDNWCFVQSTGLRQAIATAEACLKQ